MLMCAVDLIPKNLKNIQNFLWNGRTKWFNLGLELGIDEETLKVLKQSSTSEDDCFRDMLSKWLRTVNPTWEELLVALKQPSVGCDHLAKKVRDEQGVPEQRSKDKYSTTPNIAGEFQCSKCKVVGAIFEGFLFRPHQFTPLSLCLKFFLYTRRT